MADGAHCFDVVVVVGRITKMMVVLVPSLAFGVNVATVSARQSVGMRPAPGTNLNIYSLARLSFVAITRRARRWARPPGKRIDRWSAVPSTRASSLSGRQAVGCETVAPRPVFAKRFHRMTRLAGRAPLASLDFAIAAQVANSRICVRNKFAPPMLG